MTEALRRRSAGGNKEPGAAAGLIEAGRAARHRGDNFAALTYFKRAAAAEKNNVQLKLDTARCLRDLNHLDEAKRCCEDILAKHPASAAALMIIGSIARIERDYATALGFFEEAATQKPGDFANQISVARMLAELQRLDEAEARCRRILEQAPNHVRARIALGDFARQRGDTAAAVAYFDAAAQLEPDNVEICLHVIKALREIGDSAQAEERCRPFLEQKPNLVQARRELASILHQHGDIDGAIEQFQIAVRQEPADHHLALEFARLLGSEKRHEEARSICQKIHEIDPRNTAAIKGLARVARAQADWHQALVLLREAIEINPKDASLYLKVASVLFELFKYDDAEAALKRSEVCAQSNETPEYLVQRLEYFCTSMQWDRAARQVANWPSHGDVPPGGVVHVARLYAEMGRWNDAVDFFRQRIGERGWRGPVSATETLLQATAAAARHTGRYQEMLEVLDNWQDRSTATCADRMREQICEELSLLHALRQDDDGGASGAVLPAGPLHSARHGLLLAILSGAHNSRAGAEKSEPRNISAPARMSADTIFLCTDAKYLLGATVSLFSLLRHNKASLGGCNHIVYCSSDVLDFASGVLSAIGTFFGVPIELRSSAALFADGIRLRTKYGSFTPGRGLSEAAYHRMFAALQLMREKGSGRALYVDADTCVGPGIERLLDCDLQSQPLGARRQDPSQPGVARAKSRLGLDEGEYFNSGILLFELSHPKLEAALQRTVHTALHEQHLLIMHDQCAFNAGFRGLVTGLDEEFNHFVKDEDKIAEPEYEPVVTHFTAHPKPWDPLYRSPHSMLWFSEFEALGNVLAPETLKRLFTLFFPPGAGNGRAEQLSAEPEKAPSVADA